MQRVTVLPLHGGRAPRWLFPRMVKLGGLIANAVIDDFGSDEFVKRLSDPYWLQALSCAIGYDWHSSGTTTVTIGALKEALNYNSDIFIAGGKGKSGTDTPNQIVKGTDHLSIGASSDAFKERSRLLAKIDSSLVYDDIGIYRHAFIFSKNKRWTVVQQAMQNSTRSAIRFQAYSEMIDAKDMTNETNTAINGRSSSTMDLTYGLNAEIKKASVNAVNEDLNELVRIAEDPYILPKRHPVVPKYDLSRKAVQLLKEVNEMQPKDYQELLKVRGMGRKTLRSLAIISSLIYDKEVYQRDPVMYSYNLGGKDGTPYRINLKDYDNVVDSMKEIVERTRIDGSEREKALKRLSASVSMSISRKDANSVEYL